MRFLLLFISLLALQACTPNQAKVSSVHSDIPVKIKNSLQAALG
ncbi:MAG: hypothetical protein RBR37_07480 [Advenella sp.]|jgi:hypothetical protein|nr:hypothetical protein [Advenella sp.]